MHKDILSRAKKAGYETAVDMPRSLSFALVPEYGSSTIDKNGFPHYENSLIVDLGDSLEYSQVRFVKPEAA